MGVFFHHAQKQAFKFENRWRVKKSSPKSGDVSDHSPQLSTMPNWLMKFKKMTTSKARTYHCLLPICCHLLKFILFFYFILCHFNNGKFILFFYFILCHFNNGKFILFEAIFTSMHVLSVLYMLYCIVNIFISIG